MHAPPSHTTRSAFMAFICRSQPGVGVDGLMKAGRLDHLKAGPVIWVDAADSQPCIGTAGALTWHMKCSGKLFHSVCGRLRVHAHGRRA